MGKEDRKLLGFVMALPLYQKRESERKRMNSTKTQTVLKNEMWVAGDVPVNILNVMGT